VGVVDARRVRGREGGERGRDVAAAAQAHQGDATGGGGEDPAGLVVARMGGYRAGDTPASQLPPIPEDLFRREDSGE
jgi:hypothetical protein